MQVWVKYGDSFGEESIPESASSGPYGPTAPARGQQVKEVEAGVGGVLQDVSGPAETTGVIDGSRGRLTVPHCHSVGQQALDGGTVEGHQQLSV